jgi:hypothetical protein
MPDSQAFEKTNFGMRSTRFSSLALRISLVLGVENPAREGRVAVPLVDAVAGEVEHVVGAQHQFA